MNCNGLRFLSLWWMNASVSSFHFPHFAIKSPKTKMLFVFSTWPRDIFYLQHYWLVCVIKDSYTAALGGVVAIYSMATTSSTAHNLSQGFREPPLCLWKQPIMRQVPFEMQPCVETASHSGLSCCWKPNWIDDLTSTQLIIHPEDGKTCFKI